MEMEERGAMTPGEGQVPALLTRLVQLLVDEPDAVRIHAVNAEQVTILEVTVAPDDVRRVVGRSGRTVDAIRGLLLSIGARLGRRYHLEILEPTGRITLALPG